MAGFGCPLCWYFYHQRRLKAIAAVPYEEWMRKVGREMVRGEVIILGGLAFKRTMDDRVEVLVEEVGADG